MFFYQAHDTNISLKYLLIKSEKTTYSFNCKSTWHPFTRFTVEFRVVSVVTLYEFINNMTILTRFHACCISSVFSNKIMSLLKEFSQTSKALPPVLW